MVIFYKTWKKYNEIQLTKIKMDLNNRKNEESSSLPPCILYTSCCSVRFMVALIAVCTLLSKSVEAYSVAHRITLLCMSMETYSITTSHYIVVHEQLSMEAYSISTSHYIAVHEQLRMEAYSISTSHCIAVHEHGSLKH